MRSAEEWSKYCESLSSDDKHTEEGILCVHCARAYARECVEAWREKAEQAIPTNLVDPLLGGKRAALRGKGPWGCQDIERLLRAITTALRALPGETP